MTTTQTPDRETRQESPTLLDRFLRLFTDVRSGEGLTALLLTVNVFLILSSYYFVKPVREALILSQGGAELKSYLSAGQAILLLGIVPLYGALAGNMGRKRLLNVVTLFFTGCLVAFFAVQAATEIPLGIVFFLWVGIFNLMITAQFWSFANDIYTKDEGERLFPIVAFGASAGAVLGAWLAGRLIDIADVEGAMAAAAATLGVSLFFTNWIEARKGVASAGSSGQGAVAEGGEPTDSGASGEDEGSPVAGAELPMGQDNPFKVLFRNRYLLLIAFLILFVNWVNTTGGYILDRTVEEAARQAIQSGSAQVASVERFIGQFYSDFFAVVNLLGLGIQLFLVSRIIKYIGIRWAIMALPVLAMGAYVLLAFYPVLGVVRWAKTAENATDYSLNNTVRHALFLPTTREEKYKAKQAIDTIFWRAGDVLSALLVFVGAELLGLATGHFAIVNATLVSVWLVIAFVIGRQYREKAEEEDIDAQEAVAAA